ncbi:MAG: M28 family peptidase [Bacteroidota bacterium]
MKKQSPPSVAIPASQDRLYQDVAFFTSLNPPRNYLHPESLQKCIEYIEGTFQPLDCQVKRQDFQAEGVTYTNVIAQFKVQAGPRLVIGAHYDVCGEQPGADDNASALAGLLEIARLLDTLKPDLPYQIDFVAYANEEPPFFASPDMGSYVHADSLKKEGIALKAMICLEMIGYFSDEPHLQNYPIAAMKLLYPSKGNFIGVIGNSRGKKLNKHMEKHMKAAGTVDVYSVNVPSSVAGIDYSDHRNYWEMGYEAVMINDTSFYRNPNYHTEQDSIDTLDFARMTEVVKGVYWALVNFHHF